MLFLQSGPRGRIQTHSAPQARTAQVGAGACRQPLPRDRRQGKGKPEGKGPQKNDRPPVAKHNSIVFCLWAASLPWGTVAFFPQTSEASTLSDLGSGRVRLRGRRILPPASHKLGSPNSSPSLKPRLEDTLVHDFIYSLNKYCLG